MPKSKTEKYAEWINLRNPSAKDRDMLKKRFGFHEVILNEIRGPSARSRVESYDDYLFLVYYFPVYDPKEQTSHRAEVNFLITRNAVISVHYEPIEALENLKIAKTKSSLYMLYTILESLFRFEERQLMHIREKIENIGSELFSNKEKEILNKISLVKRDISEYRLIVRSEESVLNSLRDRGLGFWDKEAQVYLNDLAGDHLRIVNQIENYRQTVLDFENTNIQAMNMKVTEIMKRFTAMSFLTFPFVLTVAVLDIHLLGNPLSKVSGGFWLVLGGVLMGITFLATYFKRKDWL